MRTLKRTVLFLLIAAHCFCCGMEDKGAVLVTTSDNKAALFRTSALKKTSVLSLLYAYQKKNSPNAIIIPRASKKNDAIYASDVRSLRCLLDNQGDKFVPYMNKLSYHEQVGCARAAYVLGAQRQLFQIIDYLFVPEIKACIGSKLITDDVQEYMIKQIIRKRDIIDYRESPITDWALFSSKNGAIAYVPVDIVHYEKNILFDGMSPFLSELLLENEDNVFIEAMSCKGNYYVTRAGKFNQHNPVLWFLDNNRLTKSKQTIADNKGKITHVVFGCNETCLVMGSDAKNNNLFYWKLDPCNPNASCYDLSGHTTAIAKIIINDEGSCIVSSDKYNAEVVVWDLVREKAQLLDGNYLHPIVAMALSKDSTQLWVCSGSIISLWQRSESGKFSLLQSINLRKNDAIICRMLVNEKVGRLVVGRTDGKLSVISINTLKEVFTLTGHKKASINGLIGNDKGNIIVSSTNGIADNLMVWDISTGERLANLVGHPGIRALLLTRDMRYIVSQSPQNVCLWNLYDGLDEQSLQHIKKALTFLQYYELYNLCTMKKNAYKVEQTSSNWVELLPIIAGVKSFVERYLL